MASMTYLQLCNKLIEKCGITGGSLASVTGQTGEAARVVGWVNEAYVNIQEVHSTWSFLRRNVSFTTTDGKGSYTPAECGVTDLADWKMDSFRRYITSVGVRSEVFLGEIPYDQYRNTYLYGNLRLTTGDPISISVGPDLSLNLGLIPGSVGYTVVGEYFREPYDLVNASDTPVFPARYHMLVVYRAMMMYGMYEAAQEVYAEGLALYNSMIRRLSRDQLEDVILGAALA